MEGTDATPEEVAEFREIFNLVDLDGGGSIDLDELRELMDLLGMNASKDEMEAMVNEIDDDQENYQRLLFLLLLCSLFNHSASLNCSGKWYCDIPYGVIHFSLL